MQNNHMDIEKWRVLAQDSLYWLNMNAEIKEAVKTAQHVLHVSKLNPETK